ncbi:MAG: hypothetical protein ACLFPF_09440 [Halanaerobiales bacterium]
MGDTWIVFKTKKKYKDVPEELRINRDGKVFIDGKPYNADDPSYGNMSLEVECNSQVDRGADTEKLLEMYKKAKSGDKKVVTDIQDENEVKQTTVKF